MIKKLFRNEFTKKCVCVYFIEKLTILEPKEL